MNANNYSVKEFSKEAAGEWDSLLCSYSDYNIYQSYGWGEFKKAQGWNTLRLVCYKQDSDVALLQCVYKYYRFLKIYVIWVPGGPAFLKDLSDIQLGGLRCLLTVLLERFKNNKYYLRIYPLQKYNSKIISAIRGVGFQEPRHRITEGFTYQVDTSLPETEILNCLSSNWRHNLRRSAREKLTVSCSDSPEELTEFYKVYSEMARRKKIRVNYSLNDLLLIKDKLPPLGSLYLFFSAAGKTVLSGRAICVIGRRAFDLLAAASYEGRRRYASYLVIWEIISWCRQRNIEYFDLSGVDPANNNEVLNFKKGIGGELIKYVGEWEFSNSRLLSAITNLYIAKFIKD